MGTRRPASVADVEPSAHLAVPPARLRTTARLRASSRDAAQRHRREARFALRTRVTPGELTRCTDVRKTVVVSDVFEEDYARKNTHETCQTLNPEMTV